VYGKKTSQNVMMEEIVAGSLWDVNDEVMKVRE
jgi:hypothetical protein